MSICDGDFAAFQTRPGLPQGKGTQNVDVVVWRALQLACRFAKGSTFWSLCPLIIKVRLQ